MTMTYRQLSSVLVVAFSAASFGLPAWAGTGFFGFGILDQQDVLENTLKQNGIGKIIKGTSNAAAPPSGKCIKYPMPAHEPLAGKFEFLCTFPEKASKVVDQIRIGLFKGKVLALAFTFRAAMTENAAVVIAEQLGTPAAERPTSEITVNVYGGALGKQMCAQSACFTDMWVNTDSSVNQIIFKKGEVKNSVALFMVAMGKEAKEQDAAVSQAAIQAAERESK